VYPIRSLNEAAEVLITEPCYWTADLPFLYDLQMKLQHDGAAVEIYEQPVGLRRIGIRGQSVFIEGNRFVFRAAHFPNESLVDWHEWRDARLAMYAIDPDWHLCRSASEQGVWIIAEVSNESIADRTMNSPAVAVVVVPRTIVHSIKRQPGGPLIGARQLNGETTRQDADVLVYDARDTIELKRELTFCTRPVMVARSSVPFRSLADARSSCEQLQRDLAPELTLAGYIV
jgi:hypothetical protein